jgi:hypothetical protein
MSKATNADPIFAAIERHRVAEREFGEILSHRNKLEQELPKHLRQTDIRPRMGVNNIVETDDPNWIAAERSVYQISEKTAECSTALVETRPTTLEGLKALLRYSTDFLGDDTDISRGILENAAKAIETVTADEPAEAPVDEPAEGPDSDKSKFGRAYQELFEARACLEKLNAGGYDPDDDPDGTCDALLDRLRAAELQLASLPAALGYQLVNKFEVLETMISERERNGRPFDNRHMLMLASVKGDLYDFRIEGRKAE